ncbi:MAG: pyridoxamine 5'-phosphate oxidase family protein [Spirochaetales bacterium]|nr:pyridoxamine 5'-phosphate oxidase family protein [Spirochaetales bacterium]
MQSTKKFIESKKIIEDILTGNTFGFLGMSVDNQPYTIPITYGYNNGKIIFHCAKSGRKIDSLRRNPHVCFTIGNHFGHFVPHPQGAVCHAHSNSVICFGIAAIIEDEEERCKTLNIFNKCIRQDAREIKIEETRNCYAIEITIREMTARIERESSCSNYIYTF